jgi:hypothetical protein
MIDSARKHGKDSGRKKRTGSGLQRGVTKRTGTISDFVGCLAGKTKKVATIEEINEAAAAGWAGLVRMHDDEESE